MANPLYNEEALYEAIEKNKLQIPREIWELLNHHLRNDDQVIMFGADDLRQCLLEVIQTVACLQKHEKPLSGDDLIALLQELVTCCDSLLIHARSIERFLAGLNKAMHHNESENLKIKEQGI